MWFYILLSTQTVDANGKKLSDFLRILSDVTFYENVQETLQRNRHYTSLNADWWSSYQAHINHALDNFAYVILVLVCLLSTFKYGASFAAAK